MISLLHKVNQLVQEEKSLREKRKGVVRTLIFLKSCMLNGMRYILILQ